MADFHEQIKNALLLGKTKRELCIKTTLSDKWEIGIPIFQRLYGHRRSTPLRASFNLSNQNKHRENLHTQQWKSSTIGFSIINSGWYVGREFGNEKSSYMVYFENSLSVSRKKAHVQNCRWPEEYRFSSKKKKLVSWNRITILN